MEFVPEDVIVTVPESLMKTVPGAVMETVPGVVMETVPGDVMKTVPGAVMETVPGYLMKAVPEGFNGKYVHLSDQCTFRYPGSNIAQNLYGTAAKRSASCWA